MYISPYGSVKLHQKDGCVCDMPQGVPPRSDWEMLTRQPMFRPMEGWEKAGMMREIALRENAPPGVKHVRMNCAVRWRNTHYTKDVQCRLQMLEGLNRF